MIPRRPLQEPYGSAADWRGNGIWEDGEWTVEMWRDLQTDHPADTKQLEAGGEYIWSPAVHHGAGQRWHWVAYPYKLGLGVEPTYVGNDHTSSMTELVADEFTGAKPNWDTIRTYAIPLIFPGLIDWTDLTHNHARKADIRNTETTMWDLFENDPASFSG